MWKTLTSLLGLSGSSSVFDFGIIFYRLPSFPLPLSKSP